MNILKLHLYNSSDITSICAFLPAFDFYYALSAGVLGHRLKFLEPILFGIHVANTYGILQYTRWTKKYVLMTFTFTKEINKILIPICKIFI